MVQPIPRCGLEVVSIQSPAVKWNRHAELIFLVPLAVQRGECKILAVG